MKLSVSVRYTLSPHIGTDMRVCGAEGEGDHERTCGLRFQGTGCWLHIRYVHVNTFHQPLYISAYYMYMRAICTFLYAHKCSANSFHITVFSFFSNSFIWFSSSHYAELNDPSWILIHDPDPCREGLNPDLFLGSDLLRAREPLQRFAVLWSRPEDLRSSCIWIY